MSSYSYFLQKFVVVNPSYSEVEVAFIDGKEYLKTKPKEMISI